MLLVLYCTKYKTDCTLVFGNPEFVEITALFQYFHLIEESSEAFDELESILLDIQESYEVHELDLTIIIQISFYYQI